MYVRRRRGGRRSKFLISLRNDGVLVMLFLYLIFLQMYVYCLLRAHCLQQLYHMLSTLLSGETEPTWQVCSKACTFGSNSVIVQLNIVAVMSHVNQRQVSCQQVLATIEA